MLNTANIWYPILCNRFLIFGHARLGFTMNPSNQELPLTRTHHVDGAQVDFPPVHPPCIHSTVERHVPTPLPQIAGRPARHSRRSNQGSGLHSLYLASKPQTTAGDADILQIQERRSREASAMRCDRSSEKTRTLRLILSRKERNLEKRTFFCP